MKYPPLNKEYSPFFNVKRVFREALIILYACRNETQVFQLKEDGPRPLLCSRCTSAIPHRNIYH